MPRLPAKAPAQKAISVTTMRALPPPTVYRVPEPQPPPSCMPSPNRKLPIATSRLAGAAPPPMVLTQHQRTAEQRSKRGERHCALFEGQRRRRGEGGGHCHRRVGCSVELDAL